MYFTATHVLGTGNDHFAVRYMGHTYTHTVRTTTPLGGGDFVRRDVGGSQGVATRGSPDGTGLAFKGRILSVGGSTDGRLQRADRPRRPAQPCPEGTHTHSTHNTRICKCIARSGTHALAITTLGQSTVYIYTSQSFLVHEN